MKILIALSMLGFLSGCNDKARDAKAAVAYELRDAKSAEFRNLQIYQDGKLVCGEVNSNNTFEGKTGFKNFVYDEGRVSLEDDRLGLVGIERCIDATVKRTKTIIKQTEATLKQTEAEQRQYEN